MCSLFVFEPRTRAQSLTLVNWQEPVADIAVERKISKDILGKVAEGRGAEFVRVVIQPAANQSDLMVDSALEVSGASDIRKLKNLKVRIATLPVQAAFALAARSDVSYVSLNRDVQPLGHVSRTTGADQARSSSNGGNNHTGLDGSGIGIAIVDSGIDTGHHAFLNRSNSVRVVYSEDFTNEGRTDDPYGHGTHVASLAAGNGRISNGQYLGIAPNANLINLRVLNSQGLGTTGTVLRALDWVATNRVAYNIRVVNMSLGMPAIDSYRNDPICRAVRRLVDAGVVVFAAAG
ncbi:MAG TPA: S8 family serine peptidase, partial [Pyrinomonadaceae bacterium]|nr:S8 family serine peptidase [Pyrinomonadaceae bacterium]